MYELFQIIQSIMLISFIIRLLRFENDQWPINLRVWKADVDFIAKLLG